MSLKGDVVNLLSGVAAAGPWRSVFERTLVRLSHRYPESRTLLSFCRHFGLKSMQREGANFSRVAIFDTGGRMVCRGKSPLVLLSLPYYYVGTITGQHVDERSIARLLRRVVREGDVFFDLGANFGFYSSYVIPLCGHSGAVHAFEPNTFLMPHLQQLRAVNEEFGPMQINAVAIGRESGPSLTLYGADRIGCSSLYPHEWINRDSTIQVPVVTIDDYVRENGITRVDIVKIDIEGAELDALVGMEKTLNMLRPGLIICELTLMPEDNQQPRQDAGATARSSGAADARQVCEILREREYEQFEIVADGRLKKWDISQVHSDSLSLINIAFVRPELRERLSEVFLQV